MNDTNESNGGSFGNDTETEEDLQQDGDAGDDSSDGHTIAENVEYGEVSEYANVEAGSYTLQLVEASGETDDSGSEDTDTEDDGEMDDADTGDADTEDNESDDGGIFNLPDDLENDGPDSNGTANESDGGVGGGNASDNASDDGGMGSGNASDDGMGGANDSTGNESSGSFGNDTETEEDLQMESDGEVLYETEVTVGETYYTAAAVGDFEAGDVQVLTLQDYDAAQVRLVHASPDAPGVDVTADDANLTLFDGTQFGQATQYVGVVPGSYSLTVRVAAPMNDGDEVATFDAELESGQAYSVFATGSPSGDGEEFELVVTQDGESASADDAETDDESATDDEEATDEEDTETDEPTATEEEETETETETDDDGLDEGEPTGENDTDTSGNGTGTDDGMGNGGVGNDSADNESDGGLIGGNETDNATGNDSEGDDDATLAF
jgi:hypothetical protein